MSGAQPEPELYEVDHRVATRSELEGAVEELLRRSRAEKGLPPTIGRPDYYRRLAGILRRAEGRASLPAPEQSLVDGPTHRQVGGDQ